MMHCEKHDYVDYWACPHCLDEANAKVEKLEKGIRKVLDYHSVPMLPTSAEMALSSLLSGPGDTSKQGSNETKR